MKYCKTLIAAAVLCIALAGPRATYSHERFTVTSAGGAYNSPLIGNGEIVTTLGPTGFHNGFCPQEEQVNRTIFWAGRRLRNARGARIRIPRVPPEELIGPTRPLIRFGRLQRTLRINGKRTPDDDWCQTLVPDSGMVISVLNHGTVREETRSCVCLTENLLLFRTRLKNLSSEPIDLEFTLDYEFGDAFGHRAPSTRLHIRRPHPDDLTFGNVEGTRSLDTNIENRPPHLRESLLVHYDVSEQLGEVHIGRYPTGKIRDSEFGGQCLHAMTLRPGESAQLWFWVMLSDRLKFSYFPDYDRVRSLLRAHRDAWGEFWNACQVEFGDPDLEAIRKSCLYDIRCNASPWYVPPGYLSTTWEGRTLHDEFYPYMALLSGNWADIAVRTPNNRLRTLPEARRRSADHGAYYAWESTEEGEDSAPYGHWTDERFIAGIFSEEAWRYYLYTRDQKELARLYPVIKGCAEWIIHDVLRRDARGRLGTRLIADADETLYPVRNSIFLLCAVIRCLENAARAAEILTVDETERFRWRTLSAEVRQLLPVDRERGIYRYVGSRAVPLHSHFLAMVYPFSFDVYGPVADGTANAIHAAIKDGRLKLNWLWEVGRVATHFFYQGKADQGYRVLKRAPGSVGPFLAPCEQIRDQGGAFLAWYTVGAGAFVHAVHSMFIQVIDEGDPILLPAVPSDLNNLRFDRLLATRGVRVSARLEDGQLVQLDAHSDSSFDGSFRIPKRFTERARFAPGASLSGPDERDYRTVKLHLNKGVTHLVQPR